MMSNPLSPRARRSPTWNQIPYQSKTWSKERMNVPFPSGRAYQPIPGKAGGVMGVGGNLAELSDGAIACTGM